jgi:hypothetical protein
VVIQDLMDQQLLALVVKPLVVLLDTLEMAVAQVVFVALALEVEVEQAVTREMVEMVVTL